MKWKLCLIIYIISVCYYNLEAKCLKKVSRDVIGGNVTINLFDGFSERNSDFEEGRFIIFSYREDSTSIVIFSGVNVHTPIIETDSITNYIKFTGDSSKTSRYISLNKYFREDSISNDLRILYMYVPINKINEYDRMLDSAKYIKN